VLAALSLTSVVVAGCGADSGTQDHESQDPGARLAATVQAEVSASTEEVTSTTALASMTARGALPPSLIGREWSRLPTRQKVVALTFDCGSNAAGVPSILSTLKRTGATATFFMCGKWAESFAGHARSIAARYPVGNHTYSHPHLTRLSASAIRREVRLGAAAIRNVTGKNPKPLFRFPYGDRDEPTIRVVNNLGYGAIGWTVDTLGWKGRRGGQTTASVVRRVLDAARPGAIVLMHVGAAPDGSTLDASALPRVIKELRARGYRFVTVAQYV
jgi:peptidoglycan/xylan/chitin deacetylase (PgdA/CDA1 family)